MGRRNLAALAAIQEDEGAGCRRFDLHRPACQEPQDADAMALRLVDRIASLHELSPEQRNAIMAMFSVMRTIWSNSASSRMSSMRWQACITVVRSRPKPRPTSAMLSPMVTWVTYMPIWRTRETLIDV